MKKIIALIALAAMLFSLAACSKSEEGTETETEPVSEAEAVTETTEEDPAIDVDGPVGGGWTVYADAEGSIPEDVQASFDAALEGFAGSKLDPIAVLGTQVVAGTNYLILCRSTPMVPTAESKWVLARLYAGVDGTNEIKVVDFDFASYRDAVSENVDQQELCGGWTVSNEIPEAQLAEDAKAAFDGAFAGFDGVGYQPIALLGTQVVAGTNYAFLAKSAVVSPDAISNLAVVFVYADLEGGYELLNAANVSLADIEF